jgi:hypothetical protein
MKKAIYHGTDCRVFFAGGVFVDTRVDFEAPAGLVYVGVGALCMKDLRGLPDLVGPMLLARQTGDPWALLPFAQVVAFVPLESEPDA